MQTVSVWQKSHLSFVRHFSFLVKTKMTKFLQQKFSHFSIEFIFCKNKLYWSPFTFDYIIDTFPSKKHQKEHEILTKQ